jgi:outer membrane protein OmpA-like peptidoglycan-associated protein
MKNKPTLLRTTLALAPATALALIVAPPAAISLEAGPQGRIILAQGKQAPADHEELKERIRRAGEKAREEAQQGQDGKGAQEQTREEDAKGKQQAEEEEPQRGRKGGKRQPAAQQQQQPAEPQKGRSADAPKGGASEQTPAATGRAGPVDREERAAPGPERGRRLGVGQGETPPVATPTPQAVPKAAEQAQPQTGAEEKAVIEERQKRREERRKRREADTQSQQPARQQAAPAGPAGAPKQAPAETVEQKEIQKLAPATEETVRREGGTEVRSQTFQTDDGRRIEKRIRTRDDGDKVITTRTTTRDGRTVERERVIDRASDSEVERMEVTLGRLLGDSDPRYRYRDGRYRDRDGRYRDRRYRDRYGDRDWDRDFNIRIVIRAPIGMRLPLNRYVVESYYAPPELIYDTLTADPVVRIDRRYTVDEVLRSERVRNWMPRIDLDTITFRTNEARVSDSQLGRLDRIAEAMERAIDRNPGEKFLLEGHTDAPGSFAYNLELSEARALSVKYALMDAYGIPEENLVTEGYGEEFLKVPTDGSERLNRRVTVRRITPLVTSR